MDLLYELRRRTNYETADEYGSDADDAAVERFTAACSISPIAALLLHETLITKYAGRAALTAAVDQWTSSVRRIGPWASEPVQLRLSAISGGWVTFRDGGWAFRVEASSPRRASVS